MRESAPSVPDVVLLKWLAALGGCTALDVLLVIYRVEAAGSRFYAFLVWNLFLAWLPFGFALLHYYVVRIRPVRYVSAFLLGSLWLLFFPNAQYLITDLIHFSYMKGGISLWFDLFMLFASVWTGLLLGLLSLYLMHDLVRCRYGAAAGWLFAGAAQLLGSIGVYIGRFLRWNSWDVLFSPQRLWEDMVRLHELQPLPFILLFSAVTGTAYMTAVVLIDGARKKEGLGN